MDYTQILQIGLLFTDPDLNILSSKKIDCRNSPWALPSPGALLTTGFTPDGLKNRKNTNFELMQELDDWLRMKHWPVIFLGYNSIPYDEPVLEQNFYQNLLPHDLTTAKNQVNGQSNGRADVMRMVQMAAVYMPSALKLDTLNYYGAPSVSLRNVAEQNGIALSDDDAHDALNDIRATVGVAKLIRKSAPQVWEQAIKLATVAGVEDFLSAHAVFTSAGFGRNKEIKSQVLTALAPQKGSATRHALFNLRLDPAPYLQMSVTQLKEALLGKTGAPPNPFVMIDKDKQPALMPMDASASVLTEDDDEALYKKRAKALKADTAFLDKVAKAMALAEAETRMAAPAARNTPEEMAEKKMTAPVRAKIDAWAQEFREAADWGERAELVGGFRVRFKNELAADPSLDRFVKMAGRLVFEHAPQELTVLQRKGMQKFIAGRLLNPDTNAPYMTVAKARKELQKIEWQRKQKDDVKWKDVTDADIRRLKLYYTAIEKKYAPYSPYAKKPARKPANPANDNVPPKAAQKPAKKPSNGFNRNAPKP
ncbi:MAG: hypothetical protein KGL10_05940 [Alphaproteobacteria bacterium]|nr:hypothetical protein [Alphaproteobacteria bacterium]